MLEHHQRGSTFGPILGGKGQFPTLPQNSDFSPTLFRVYSPPGRGERKAPSGHTR